MTLTAPRDLSTVEPLGSDETADLFVASASAFATFLEQLDASEWNAVTRCDPWTVKDVAGHVLGWNAALSSTADLRRQITGAFRYRKRFGNLTDAQNETQVDLARALSPPELIGAIRDRAPRAARVRRRMSRTVGFVPIYFPYLGGWHKSRYLLDVIFLRDLLMHRSDCADATGRDPRWDEGDRRVMRDMIADWAKRTTADVMIELDGGETYRAGEGRGGTIRASLVDLSLYLGNRASREAIVVEGDTERVDRWLASGVPV